MTVKNKFQKDSRPFSLDNNAKSWKKDFVSPMKSDLNPERILLNIANEILLIDVVVEMVGSLSFWTVDDCCWVHCKGHPQLENITDEIVF